MTHEINLDAIPGNVTLVDTNHDLAARHSKDQADIILVPTPSNDPDDPLNWTKKRKILSLFSMVVYCFGIGIPSAAIYSIIPHVSAEIGISVSEVNTGTGYLFLFLGISAFIFQPIALQYGKRPVYLLSLLGTCLICVWVPYCKTNAEWIGSKILQGFFGSPIESLCEISVSDVSFQHQLSRNMSIYAVALYSSNFLAPMVAGFISDGIGWKWVIWLCSIFTAVCFVFCFFFMEETNYERKLTIKNVLEQIEQIDGIETGHQVSKFSEEKNLETVLSADQIVEERLKESNEIFVESTNNSEVTSKKPLKTFKDKISLIGGMRSKFILGHLLLGPFKMIQFPSVLWGGFLYGSSLIWFNLLNATEATILGGPPYHFSSSMCGLAYISPTIFSIVFQFSTGNLADWIKVTIARRRGGLSYAEDRLWVLVIYMILGLLSSIGWGVGAYYGVHWFLLVFCFGILGGLGIFAAVGGTSYAVDSYHELEAEAMVIVIVIRNLMSFACSYGLTSWVDNMGYKKAFICSGFILFFCNGTFLIMNYTGLFWRNKTKKNYWKLVEKNREVLSAK